jgi:hypothetical protein
MSETKLQKWLPAALPQHAGQMVKVVTNGPAYYLASDADARIAEQSQAHADIEAEMGAVIINANRRIADLERDHALIKEAALGERNLRLVAERERDELRKRVEELEGRTAIHVNFAWSPCEHCAQLLGGSYPKIGSKCTCTPPAAQGAQP